ncbi:unnamed protein product [Protopolystoma xenopodis]|uniref:Uncharacterized protein n=1 Tax=Protopolystoma xenopodis TaxID=117903 RepID=A0A3S5AV90_9PLAT|nr:unnamed protein product [Protopolystoma xenopodis]
MRNLPITNTHSFTQPKDPLRDFHWFPGAKATTLLIGAKPSRMNYVVGHARQWGSKVSVKHGMRDAPAGRDVKEATKETVSRWSWVGC